MPLAQGIAWKKGVVKDLMGYVAGQLAIHANPMSPGFDQAAQVLDGCHQQKLFSCSGKPSEFQPGEAEMLLHMSKEYFDLLA